MDNKKVCDCEIIHKDKVTLAKKSLKKFKEIGDLTNFYKSIADETRLKILCLLDKCESMCVCDISVALNMTMSAISHQLSYLKNNKLIKSNKTGKIVFYSLADDHIRAIFELGLEHIQELYK